jgi:thioredoxin 1
MGHLQEVSDADFESEVINAKQPVLVDFWAPWCGPCKMVTPVLEELSSHYGEKIKIVKVNVDDNNETAAKFGIRSIPSLLLFKSGEVVATKIGALSRAQLTEFLDGHIGQ